MQLTVFAYPAGNAQPSEEAALLWREVVPVSEEIAAYISVLQQARKNPATTPDGATESHLRTAEHQDVVVAFLAQKSSSDGYEAECSFPSPRRK